MASGFLKGIELLRSIVWVRLMNIGRTQRSASFDGDHVSLSRNGKVVKALPWAEIDKIYGEKTDQFTIEGIYIVLHTPTSTLAVEELDVGFKALVAFLEEKYPGMNREWYAQLNSMSVFAHTKVDIWAAS